MAVVVGGLILVVLIAYGLYRIGANPHPETADATTGAAPPVMPITGTPITASAPMVLSPQARIAAERYRCVCGCNDPLAECTCTRRPGSIEMKEHLQDLVNRELTMTQIDEEMVSTYGDQVLLSNPPAGEDVPDPSP